MDYEIPIQNTGRKHISMVERIVAAGMPGKQNIIVALDGDTAVGFITALSDGVNSAFIPLLEVLPEYQSHGIGSELMRRMLIKLDDITNIDLTCDADMQAFYEMSVSKCCAQQA